MTDIVKADIFFFVTTIAVIVVSALLVAAIIYAIKIMRDVKHISETARKEVDEVAKDIGELRSNAKREGSRVYTMITTFLQFLFKKKSAKNKKL